MTPSKLSTLTDEWVNVFTPFQSKVCLVGFLMKMVLPNLKHAWGFAGFKDEHDALRRKRESEIPDASRGEESVHRIPNVELEKERQRIQHVCMHIVCVRDVCMLSDVCIWVCAGASTSR